MTGPGHPRSSAKLWHGMNRAGIFVWLAWEVLRGATTKADLSLPCLRASQHPYTPHDGNLSFSSLSISPTSPSSSQGGLSPTCRTPGLVHQVCDSTHLFPRVYVHLCNLPCPLSFLPRIQIPTQSLCFSSSLIMCVFFFQPWLCKYPASFQLIVHGNFSTRGCIFDMFMRGR